MKINATNLNQKISDKIAFIAIIIAGAAIAWFTISIGQKIIDNAPNSAAFNVSERLRGERR